MNTYRVHLTMTVSTNVEVEAEDQDEAVELAVQRAPSATNSTNHGIDESGEWTEVSITDETGEEIWSDYPQDRERDLQAEVTRLTTRVAELEAQLAAARAS